MTAKRKYCESKTRAGTPCQRPAGWGTDHPGYGRCKLHGGSTPNGKKHAEREMAVEVVRTYGLPRDIGPHDALLEEVQRTAGHVAWLGQVVADLEQRQLTHGVTKTVQLPDGGRMVEAKAAVNVWVRLYQDERVHLVRVAKAAVDAGVAERAVRIAEGQAQQLAQKIGGILVDLGHDLTDPKVQEIVRRHLTEGVKEINERSND